MLLNVECWSRLTIEITLKVEKNIYYFENKQNSPPKKNAWGTRWDKHTNNYAGTLPWKVFIASQGHW